jgi:hypothetical protein
MAVGQYAGHRHLIRIGKGLAVYAVYHHCPSEGLKYLNMTEKSVSILRVLANQTWADSINCLVNYTPRSDNFSPTLSMQGTSVRDISAHYGNSKMDPTVRYSIVPCQMTSLSFGGYPEVLRRVC